MASLLDGMAETVKIAMVADAALFGMIEDHGRRLLQARFAGTDGLLREILRRAIRGMLAQLSTNFFEDRGFCRAGDFGHTFSGTLEVRSGYALSHGHAVAIDMALSAAIAVELGLLPAATFERLVRTLSAVGLPIHSPLLTAELGADALGGACLHRGGTPNLVVPRAIGVCDFVTDMRQLPQNLLQDAIAHLQQCERVGPGAHTVPTPSRP